MTVVPDQAEVKDLALKFTEAFFEYFPEAKDGDQDEILRQMITTMAALKMVANVIKDQAEEMGFEISDLESGEELSAEQISGGH